MDSVFEIKIRNLAANDPRYHIEAYRFITDSVSFTVERLSEHRHVTAQELMQGMRDFAVREYGVLAEEVVRSWGIHTASDAGNLVYLLIGAELLSASPGDKRSDFDIDYPPYPPMEQQLQENTVLPLPKIDQGAK